MLVPHSFEINSFNFLSSSNLFENSDILTRLSFYPSDNLLKFYFCFFNIHKPLTLFFQPSLCSDFSTIINSSLQLN